MSTEEFLEMLFGNTAEAPANYSADIVLINLAVALVLSVIIAVTYRYIHHGISYSQSYVYSIVLVSMTVALAMMVIGNDITRAFALLGTFTIIRYRTAVKDPRDTAFIFISLVTGLAVGSSNYGIAIVGTLAMCLTAIALDRVNFGAAEKLDNVVYVRAAAKELDIARFEERMRDLFAKAKLLNVNYSDGANSVTYVYNVTVNRSSSVGVAAETLAELEGVENAEILTAHNVVEF